MNRHPHRLAAATAAVAISSAGIAGLLGLFDAAAGPWLPDTTANHQRMAACEHVHGSAARADCAQRVVAAVVQRQADGKRLALAVIPSVDAGRER